MRYLKKPGFWVQIFIFIIVSSLFYNGFITSEFFMFEGLEAGLKMGLRAIMIVIGFSAISTELRNPLIKSILFKKGFWQLYTALGLSFSVLPYLIEQSPKPKELVKNPFKTVINGISNAWNIYERFTKLKNNLKVYAVTGKIHEGKTKFTEQLIIKLQDANIKLKGFTAIGKFNDMIRTEFSIHDIQSGESEILCKSREIKGNKNTERFIFQEKGLELGRKILNIQNITENEIIVIDEIGPYELKGKGWSESIESLINSGNNKMIWVVRKNLIYDIFRRFGITDAVIFDISEDSVEHAADIIIKQQNFT
jgi:nucleoside-triphosphatase